MGQLEILNQLLQNNHLSEKELDRAELIIDSFKIDIIQRKLQILNKKEN